MSKLISAISGILISVLSGSQPTRQENNWQLLHFQRWSISLRVSSSPSTRLLRRPVLAHGPAIIAIIVMALPPFRWRARGWKNKPPSHPRSLLSPFGLLSLTTSYRCARALHFSLKLYERQVFWYTFSFMKNVGMLCLYK